MNGSDIAAAGPWLAAVPAFLASTAVAWWHRRYRGLRSGAVLCKVGAAGLVAGRLAFVLQDWRAYSRAPLSVFDLGDGGFAGTAALLAAFVLGAELTRHAAPLRRPVFAAALAGTLAWLGGTAATAHLAPTVSGLPQVELRRLDGTAVRLGAFRGRPMVVNLWTSWCPPCRREMPLLAAAQRRYPGISFVFVNQGESPAAIARFLDGEGLALENVFADRAGQAGSLARAVAFPTTLFFDAQGRLLVRQSGELHGGALEQRLALLMPPG